jgi:hypothetical protein
MKYLLSLLILLPLQVALADAGSAGHAGRYIYGWPFIDQHGMQPRGGITAGPDVRLAREPSAEWTALGESGISSKERDRRAILAMAGPYRVSFDFLETVGFSPAFQPDRPYRSWGTEYIYVIADEAEFISLQHIMVMLFELGDGTISEPMVIKHWRQDWTWQDRDLHVYAGNSQWRHKRLDRSSVRGKWSQAVFQVDDSPRYEAVGEWVHSDNFSIWHSDETWRPLPRREFSVRDDYDVLIGTNRVTIQPTGWVQEEDNLKVSLPDPADPDGKRTTLAREAGINRYERINDHDWSAGDAYWQRTSTFWGQVRQAWADIYRERDSFRLQKPADGQPLYATMFEHAERAAESGLDAASARAEVDAILGRFLAN